ncbi:MAG: type I-C CRISPR-associated protein Cas8c/Csd1 [Desulfomonilaceae bacterium]
MLNLLAKYALDHDLEAEPGFKPKQVRWLIVLDDQGVFVEVIELGKAGESKNRGAEFRKCPDLSQPELISGGGTRCQFLVETADVVTQMSDKKEAISSDDAREKNRKKFEFFKHLLRSASLPIPQLGLIAKCLDDEMSLGEIQSRLQTLKAKPTDKVTFKVGALLPLESDIWHEWWRGFKIDLNLGKSGKGVVKDDKSRKKNSKVSPKNLMRCFVTGERVEPVKTHPKIEKLADVGGIPSGDVLIGFDKDSFCSYGLSQSENAAVGEQAVAAYRAGLNHLIKETGQRLAGAKIVHWFKKKIVNQDDPLDFLMEPEEIQELSARHSLNKLLTGIREGKRSDLLENHYYAMTLSGASGRIMIRDWIEGDFAQLVLNVANWFNDLSIVRSDGAGLARDPKFLAVLGGTVRKLDDLQPPFISKMWRVAVCGEPIPGHVMTQALLRTKIDIIKDEGFNHARMGLIKAFNLRKQRQKGGSLMQDELRPLLNENHPDPAYQCGRLMAVMAQLQRRALGDVGAGLIQRYYAAASSTPALVLGRLTRTSQFHLNKLDPGLAHWYDSKIAEIWSRIKDNVPRILSLESQSVFALGYYQQIADLRSGKSTDSNEKQGADNE